MNVIIIGSGNVATVLGRAIKSAGHIILQVYGRNLEKAKLLANELAAEPIDNFEQLNVTAEFFLIALNDAAIQDAAQKIHLQKGILMHTAGSVSKNVLKEAAANHGVLYPLQSLRKEKKNYQDIPFLVDGSSVEVISTITAFAKTISFFVQKADDEERLKLHLAAVVVSNFPNYLFALAEDYCQKENVTFTMLQPLISEVANRLQNNHAAEMQTGPAIRKDIITIEKHIELLKNYSDLQATYAFLSNKIMKK